MNTRFETPLAGCPATVESRDRHGNPQFRIKPRELTPGRAKAADSLRSLLQIVLIITAIIALYRGWRGPWENLAWFAGVLLAAYIVISQLVRASLHVTTTIKMNTEAISVRRWYGWKRYDRNVEHRFALLLHDLANKERQTHDYAIRSASSKGHVVQKIAYYGESFHVVLAYAGHRIDLLTVYGPRPAAAIVARLQYCDRRLNEAVNMGGGLNQHPDDEWNDTPGGLDDA